MAIYKVNYDGISPEKCHSHTLTFCRDRMIFFGGTDGEESNNDLLFFELSSNMWVKPKIQNPDQAPSPRFSHVAQYVPMRNGFIVYSGTDSTHIFSDMHFLNLSSLTCRKIGDRGRQPPARYGSQSFFLSFGVMIVIAGTLLYH